MQDIYEQFYKVLNKFAQENGLKNSKVEFVRNFNELGHVSEYVNITMEINSDIEWFNDLSEFKPVQ